MKIIFLDIDGVINLPGSEIGWRNMGVNWRERLGNKNATRIDSTNIYCGIFDPSSLYQLRRIIDETEAKIVISSTWRRHGDLAKMKSWFLDPVIAEAVIGKTDSYFGAKYEHLRDRENRIQRGEEIYGWIQEHPEVEKYAVLDDDGDMDAVRENFFQTNGWTGITPDIAKRIIKHLNFKKWTNHYRLNHAFHDFYSEVIECLRDTPKEDKDNLINDFAKRLDEMCIKDDEISQERWKKEKEARSLDA